MNSRPKFFRIAAYASDFHDISDNSSNGYYPAVSGFDDATGWGSMNGQNLFEDLSAGSVPTSGRC